MPFGNLAFFVNKIAAYVDDFHSVAQCRMYRLQRIGGSDKQHFRQVEFYFYVVVVECVVLFRVKEFQKSCRRVAIDAHSTHFVYFIKDEDRVG